ncbi:putative secreted protein (plasmid) [Actinacidiphila reveromycinica]|uniref:Putative secreted protein n=1 Tax=Actinacidiphila reveromycinica TaxID=659352 RepID=A0A7R6QEE4_9ACTN|nr:C40 family peptidase [Streptomyces sp. SN-593]BBG20766.1 putative secreted protein [Streptomyces sp. SN-593]
MPAAAVMLSSRAGRRIALTATAAGLAGCLALVVSAGAMFSADASSEMASVDCPISGVSVGDAKGAAAVDLSGDQVTNAQTIIAVGQQMNVSVKGQVIAIATALQESSLHNLDHGDRDSLGLFQQRPSQGWGTRDQILDPTYASTSFYKHLLTIKGWEDMPVTVAAQRVQHSAFPDAYADHEQQAVQIVADVGPSTGNITQIDTSGCTSVSSTATGTTLTMLQAALDQVGKPYVWGATGPDAFDCSGLVIYAWRQAGRELTVRTSQQMYNIATPIASGQEQPGDLAFTGWGEQGPGPGHVMIVVKRGEVVEAPHTGSNVKVRAYNATNENLKFGRLPDSALTDTSSST